MINKITNNKISITIGIPIDKNQFASVRPVTIYPIRDIKAIVTAYVVSVLTWMMKLQFTQELTKIVLSQIGEILSPNTEPHRQADKQGTSNLISVCLQIFTTIGINTENSAHIVPS